MHSEAHLKQEVSKLRKELDEQTRKLSDLMRSSHEETDRLRQDNLNLQAKVFEQSRGARAQQRDEEVKTSEESITK